LANVAFAILPFYQNRGETSTNGKTGTGINVLKWLFHRVEKIGLMAVKLIRNNMVAYNI
jgi:hypothetical protein